MTSPVPDAAEAGAEAAWLARVARHRIDSIAAVQSVVASTADQNIVAITARKPIAPVK